MDELPDDPSLVNIKNEVMQLPEVDSLSTNNSATFSDSHEYSLETAVKSEEDESQEILFDPSIDLNEELQAGYRILTDLMAHAHKYVNWPFMESVQNTDPALYEEYKLKIKKPVWLKLMKNKFETMEYTSITQFVSDFRLMLENCYHFNGPDHFISKRALKMEMMLEQKLALLSRDIRDKTSLNATSGERDCDQSSSLGLRRRPRSHVPHNSNLLMNQLREEQIQRKKERRRQQIMDRRAEREALAQEITTWEDNILFDGKKDEMKAMWEIPQIGLFLFLLQSPLNIGEVMHFELERCFMIPRESSTMQRIMTSLLSTPFQRFKIDKKSLMPYKVWESKLRYKFQVWYKMYADSRNNREKTCFKLGIEEQFFDVVGDTSPLERKQYHELGMYKKVWIMKALCDHCLHMQETLRDIIELQSFEDQRELVLGTDSSGQRYIHFPQFCGADVRVYRQAPVKYPKLVIKPDPFESKRKYPFVYKPPPIKKMKLKTKKKSQPSPVKQTQSFPRDSPLRQRPSRLRQAPKSVMPLQLGYETPLTEDYSNDDDDDDDNSSSIGAEEYQQDDTSVVSEPVPGPSGIGKSCDLKHIDNALEDVDNRSDVSCASDATVPYCEESDSNSNLSSRECSRESSPIRTGRDLSSQLGSTPNQCSDISRESSPCISPADFLPRRSARLDRSADNSRDASPLIFDADFGLRRGSQRRRVLKNIPPYNAARDLSSFLLDENSASNSSMTGENSLSGQGTSRWQDKQKTSRQSSCDTGEDDNSNFCDIRNLFSTAKTMDDLQSALSLDQGLVESEGMEAEDISGSNGALQCDDSGQVGKKGGVKENGDSLTSDSSVGKGKQSQVENNTAVSGEHVKESVATSESVTSGITTLCGNVGVSLKRGEKSYLQTQKGQSTNEGIESGVSNHVQSNGEKEDLNEPGTVTDMTSIKQLEENSQQHTENHSLGKSMNESATVEHHERNKENEKLNSENVDEKSVQSSDYDVMNQDSAPKSCEIKNSVARISENNEVHHVVEDIKSKSSSDFLVSHVSDKECEENGNVQVKIEPKVEMEEKVTIKKEFVNDDSRGEKPERMKEELDSLKDETMKEESDDDGSLEIKREVKDKDVKTEVKAESDSEDEVLPDPEEFMMVADSVEQLRLLAQQFAEPEPIPGRRFKKNMTPQPPPRKKNIVELHERVLCLLRELEPWEHKLLQATRNARIRMRRELEDYVEPDEENADWNTSDEEATESGDSEAELKEEAEIKPSKPRLPASENTSRASTPVKPAEEGDIDISQRGRLRKRRIIPNNVEDQYATKKSRPVKPEHASTHSQTDQVPMVVQSGKTQFVDYADILKQLKNNPVVKPVLIKSIQGGKTVITSVIPVSSSSTNASVSETLSIQDVKFTQSTLVTLTGTSSCIDPNTTPPPGMRLASPGGSEKMAHHPTIRTLLSTCLAPPPSSTAILGTSSVLTTGMDIDGTVEVSGVSVTSPLFISTIETQQSTRVTVAVNGSTTPSKLPIPRLGNPTGNQIAKPRKIAPNTSVVASSAATDVNVSTSHTRYYAANASTLPINVVQQLISERGAKISQGAYNQTILLIPMGNDWQTKSQNATKPETVTTPPTPTKTTVITLASNPNGSQVSPLPVYSASLVSSATMAAKTSPNQLILPKPPIVSALQTLTRPSVMLGPPGAGVTPTGMSPNRLVSPVPHYLKYPNNETVRNLLDKRKSSDEKKPPYKFMKLFLSTTKPETLSLSEFSSLSSSISSQAAISTDTSLSTTSQKNPASMAYQTSAVVPIINKMILKEQISTDQASINAIRAQQCVVTSISPAKLNTLLLQTSAAGAKILPSVIKLPSKAALDSAVKAVVTSVNTSLPTVNIKVPSPTSLPSIGPRRNVTKTVQTMKSPITVAPKVVTQCSGGQARLTPTNTNISSAALTSQAQSAQLPSLTPGPSAVVQGKDGKMAVAKFTPHLLITSKGVMQVGYVNADSVASGSVSPETTVVSSEGTPASMVPVLLPVAQNAISTTISPTSDTSDSSDGSSKKGSKPVIALNANGIPIGAVRLATSSTSKQMLGPLATPVINSSVAVNPEIKPCVGNMANLLSKISVASSPSAGMNKPGLVSPLMNLKQGNMVVPGGVQLTNPLMNKLGLNLLQHGVQPAQNSTLLQTLQTISTTATSTPLVGINPLLLNASAMSKPALLLNHEKLQVNVNPASSPFLTQTSNLVSPMRQVMAQPVAAANPQLNLLTPVSVMSSPAQRQLVFQYPSAGQQLAALGSRVSQSLQQVGSQAPPSTSVSRQTLTRLLTTPITGADGKTQTTSIYTLANTVVSQTASLAVNHDNKASLDVKLPKGVITPAVIQIPRTALTAEHVAAAQIQTAASQNPAPPRQQKLLLFSIGGQLVTGQGIPVTLSNGVLKVMPNGKVKINNQTLTHEQVKQTLSKINHNAAALGINQGPVVTVQQTSPCTDVVYDQNNVPVKIVKQEQQSSPSAIAAVDQKSVLVPSVKQEPVSANGDCAHQAQEKIIRIRPSQLANASNNKHNGSDLHTEHEERAQGSGFNIYSSDMKINQESEIHMVATEKERPSVPMQNIISGVNFANFSVNKDARGFVVKKPTMKELNGSGDASSVGSSREGSSVADEEDHKLVIDDEGVNEKEAALNLLSLANQTIKEENPDV